MTVEFRNFDGSIKGMRALVVSLWIGLVAACGTSGNLIGGPFIDAWGDPGADTPVDAGADTGIDPPADPVPDDPPIEPFAFVLINPSDEPMYVEWSFSGRQAIVGGRWLGYDFVSFEWFHPFCTVSCASIPPGECGCMECEPYLPVMLEIPPEGEVRIEWDGPDVFHIFEDDCGCWCTVPEPLVLPGVEPHYVVAGFESWSGFACWGGCGPDEDGIIHDAYPDGERLCALADAWLPAREDMVLVLGGAVCWEDWEHGP